MLFLILLFFGLHILALFVQFIAKIVLSFDYFIIFAIVWMIFFQEADSFSLLTNGGLLVQFELHTAFIILIILVALSVWWGLQQISILGFRVFKVFACVFSAAMFTLMFIAPELDDIIWTWTLGILLFGISLFLRSKDDGLVD